MQINVIDTYSEFEKLQLNWDSVYQTDPDAQFFLSWIWLSQVFVQRKANWCILAVKPEEGSSDYVAFFPLRVDTRMSKSRQMFYNDIKMAGSFSWADYTGIICLPDFEEEAIPSLAAGLKLMHWTNVYLKYFYASDRRLDLFIAQFPQSDFFIEKRQRTTRQGDNLLISPYVDLSDDFETHLKEKMSPNARQKIRRLMRKIENSENFHITHSVPDTYERDLTILVDFWEKKWVQDKGKDVETLAKKYRNILQQGLERDLVFMPVLWRDDTPLGVLGSFIDWEKKVLLFFVGGRDESCTDPPPGLVLHAHSIRWAIENGLKTYDLLRGDEKYKYSFGAAEHRTGYIILSTKSGTNLNRTLDPRSIDDVMKYTARYQEAGRVKEAEKGYQQVLDVCPDNPVALRRYGRLMYQNNNFAKAQEIYLRLVNTEPGKAAAWLRLGKSRLALNEFLNAELALRKAIKLSPFKTLTARYYLGCALQGQDRETEAVREFKNILNLLPNDFEERKKQQKARERIENSKLQEQAS